LREIGPGHAIRCHLPIEQLGSAARTATP